MVCSLLKNQNENLKNSHQYELACTDMLVPENHLLRLINQHVDFSFITEKLRPYYSDTKGRPSIDPIVLFKMMLIGYIYGIRSERRLEQEIIPNAAYRWFLGFGLTDPIPDHSTISYNRNNRFAGTNVFQEIFDEVVHMAIRNRMVAGRVLVTDSTHIQANANKNKYTVQVVTDTPQGYLKELEQSVNDDRKNHGKKPLPPTESKKSEKKVKLSTTDSESGFMMRKNKPEGFFYLDHRTIDHKMNIITDVFVTPGNVNDDQAYVQRLQRQIDTFGFHSLEAVTLDSGYKTPNICKKMIDMNLFAVIADRKSPTVEGMIPKRDFLYDKEQNCYHCPGGEKLQYTTTNRQGYREYRSDPNVCGTCPLLKQCTSNQLNQRVIQRHVWEDYKEKVTENYQSTVGRQLYKLRSYTIERSFADAKELHGLRRSRMRGREKNQEQALMTAIAQNISKIARHLAKHFPTLSHSTHNFLGKLLIKLHFQRACFSTA